MSNWGDIIWGAFVGGIARFELDSFLNRGHNRRIEAIQKEVLLENQKQTSLLRSIDRRVRGMELFGTLEEESNKLVG